jgi:hypothetical protein
MDIRADGADIEGEFVPAGSIIWGAGVKASPPIHGSEYPVSQAVEYPSTTIFVSSGLMTSTPSVTHLHWPGRMESFCRVSRRSPSNKEHTLDKAYDREEPCQVSGSRTAAIRR